MRKIIIIILLLSIIGCAKKSNTFTIPPDYEYYRCVTWKWEGDYSNTIEIPNGEFWGMIRYYNILEWDEVNKRLSKDR